MQIDNIEELKNNLSDTLILLLKADDIKKELERQIEVKDNETLDYLHELELAKLNGIEIMQITKKLIKVRQDRRILKNKWEVIKTIKGYTDICITKGLVAQIKQALENLDKLETRFEERIYKPKAIKDLKCAQKEKQKNKHERKLK